MNAETVTVPHLGTSTIGYRFGRAYDASLPTLVMVNSFSTSTGLFRPQFADEQLAATVNLLALEPYGHGRTRASYRQFTYWDSAVANLQVDRKSTRLNSSHANISYAVFCLKKKQTKCKAHHIVTRIYT